MGPGPDLGIIARCLQASREVYRSIAEDCGFSIHCIAHHSTCSALHITQHSVHCTLLKAQQLVTHSHLLDQWCLLMDPDMTETWRRPYCHLYLRSACQTIVIHDIIHDKGCHASSKPACMMLVQDTCMIPKLTLEAVFRTFLSI